MLTRGQVADAGDEFLANMPACDVLHGDEGYESNALRRQIEAGGAMPNIPPKADHNWINCFSPFLYRNRNAVNFLAAVCIAATVSY
ncbi:MAG: hypothetical protein EKK29_11300 [Hyphomicrobiales bacterium]|nr:MAG: hypothetical protein EKK29_11300 [Hyphomicrobiales bacterium]